MQTLFDLSQGQSGKILIKKIVDLGQDLFLRLNQLGFIPGEVVELQNISPIFKGSVLVNIRGGKIALSRGEAEAISIERL